MMLLLRLIHIVLGVFWAGSMFFVVSFLLPTARAAGPAGGPFMLRFARSPFVNALTGAGVLTVLSGFALFWFASGQMNAGWLGSPTGIVLSIGGLAATLALAIGLTVQRPTALRLGALAGEIEAGGGVPSEAQKAELPTVQARLMRGGRWIATLQLVAVICMAIARYV